MELVFAMKLHISPCELEQMYFYDILYLYKAYADFVDEEAKQQKEQEAQYKQDYEDKMPDYKNFNFNGKVPDMSHFDMSSLPNMGNLPKMPSGF
jgi:hypothetical protein